jgi:hypothetical protein
MLVVIAAAVLAIMAMRAYFIRKDRAAQSEVKRRLAEIEAENALNEEIYEATGVYPNPHNAEEVRAALQNLIATRRRAIAASQGKITEWQGLITAEEATIRENEGQMDYYTGLGERKGINIMVPSPLTPAAALA